MFTKAYFGAGWLAPEYEMAGLAFDRPGVRVDRLMEAVAVMKGCFGDEPVVFEGIHYRVRGLNGTPKPVQRPHPPLLVAAAGKRLLSFAAREADIIGIAPSISAKQLGDQPPRQSVEAAVDEQIAWIRAAGRDRDPELNMPELNMPELNMVAFPLAVTDDAAGAAERIARAVSLSPEEVLRSPHIWVGSPAEIVDSLERHRERWGVSYWAVPANAIDRVAPVIDQLAGR